MKVNVPTSWEVITLRKYQAITALFKDATIKGEGLEGDAKELHDYHTECALISTITDVEPAELQKLAGKAIHVHISDCDGKVHGDLPPGRGVVNFQPYLDEIRKLNIEGAISIELEYSPEPDKIEEWVAEAYSATADLLAETGLRG